MSNLSNLIRDKASIEAIKADLYDNRHDKDYVNVVDKDGTNALMCACAKGNTEIVKLLLTEDVNVNTVDTDGTNALMYACIYNRIEVVKLLIAKDADVNVVNKYGRSAFMHACIYGDTGVVELLKNCNNYLILHGKTYKLVEVTK